MTGSVRYDWCRLKNCLGTEQKLFGDFGCLIVMQAASWVMVVGIYSAVMYYTNRTVAVVVA